jgi:hypothetical protein
VLGAPLAFILSQDQTLRKEELKALGLQIKVLILRASPKIYLALKTFKKNEFFLCYNLSVFGLNI